MVEYHVDAEHQLIEDDVGYWWLWDEDEVTLDMETDNEAGEVYFDYVWLLDEDDGILDDDYDVYDVWWLWVGSCILT